VRDVTDMIRARAEEKNLSLLLEEPADFPSQVRLDAAKLRQVLINLLGNAVKYTEKGTITVRFGAQPLDSAERVLLTLDVEDTGIGIAVEDQVHIFDAFRQVENALAQKGTGLGLTITKQFVELMGGTIHIQSTLGKGSVFRVEMPVERGQDSAAGAPIADVERIVRLQPNQPECRILIVEDEWENSTLLKRLLQNAGFQVGVAKDGSEGVEMFRVWRPHFIWMDLRMPVMNGKEATRRIRGIDGGLDVKIAGVTASAFASERDEVIAAGMDDFVRKPYKPAEIFDCLARHLKVQYVREPATRHGGAQPEPLPAAPMDAIAALPLELRVELSKAVISLDCRRIGEMIALVSQHDAVLGRSLGRSADRLAFTEILNAIDAGTAH
jgi:CheY-like chemotaxis protein/anti-sigma regulatory factor (Ser/Thr protein kinase)